MASADRGARHRAARRAQATRTQIDDLRSVFVKIAVRVEELKRSIKLAFPGHLPHADALALVTGRLTAEAS